MGMPDEVTGSKRPVRSVAYLVSRYPTLSMVFVLREVVALRGMGFRIETASINRPDRTLENLTEVERNLLYRGANGGRLDVGAKDQASACTSGFAGG